MRPVPTVSTEFAGSQAHNALDFLSFRSLGDLWWYKRAMNRAEEPMGVVRAVGGAASSLAVRGAVALGGYLALRAYSGIPGVAVPLALSAGRALVTSALDKASGLLASDGDNPDLLKMAWKGVYGEEIITTGWKKIAGQAKRKSANQVMGQAASKSAGNDTYQRGAKKHSEWLHLLGRQLGGESEADNFVAGAYHANTEMIPIENAVRAATDRGNDVYYKVTAFLDPGTRNANRINVRVNLGWVDRINYNIDANRGPFSGAEWWALSKMANIALGNWG